MSTPVSNSTAYITAAELLVFVDFRTLSDLCSDDNGRPLKSDFTDSTTVLGATTVAILKAASGYVEMACLNGGRYTPDDLAGLTGNQAQALKKIVANLALWDFYCRRPDPGMPEPPQCAEANRLLDAIASGEKIFGIQETIDAGHAELTIETPQDVVARNLITYQSERMLGRRANRTPRSNS